MGRAPAAATINIDPSADHDSCICPPEGACSRRSRQGHSRTILCLLPCTSSTSPRLFATAYRPCNRGLGCQAMLASMHGLAMAFTVMVVQTDHERLPCHVLQATPGYIIFHCTEMPLRYHRWRTDFQACLQSLHYPCGSDGCNLQLPGSGAPFSQANRELSR